VLFLAVCQHLPAELIVRVVSALAPQYLVGLDHIVASGLLDIVDNATLRACLHGITILPGTLAIVIKAMRPAIGT